MSRSSSLGRRVLRSVAFGFLTAAIVAAFRWTQGDGPPTAADFALSALAFSIGAFIGGFVAGFFSHRARRRPRSVRGWAIGFGVVGALLFVSSGLLNGANWTWSQWWLAALCGAVVGAALGGLVTLLWNAGSRTKPQLANG